jgi:hypothetical protein
MIELFGGEFLDDGLRRLLRNGGFRMVMSALRLMLLHLVGDHLGLLLLLCLQHLLLLHCLCVHSGNLRVKLLLELLSVRHLRRLDLRWRDEALRLNV